MPTGKRSSCADAATAHAEVKDAAGNLRAHIDEKDRGTRVYGVTRLLATVPADGAASESGNRGRFREGFSWVDVARRKQTPGRRGCDGLNLALAHSGPGKSAGLLRRGIGCARLGPSGGFPVLSGCLGQLIGVLLRVFLGFELVQQILQRLEPPRRHGTELYARSLPGIEPLHRPRQAKADAVDLKRGLDADRGSTRNEPMGTNAATIQAELKHARTQSRAVIEDYERCLSVYDIACLGARFRLRMGLFHLLASSSIFGRFFCFSLIRMFGMNASGSQTLRPAPAWINSAAAFRPRRMQSGTPMPS